MIQKLETCVIKSKRVADIVVSIYFICMAMGSDVVGKPQRRLPR